VLSTQKEGIVRLAPVKLMMAVTLAAATVLVVPGTSVGETSRIKAAGAPGSFHWNPTSRTIDKGEKIVWKNPTSAKHSVTAYGDGWSKNTTIQAGEKTGRKFKQAGTFLFRCRFHSTLNNGSCGGMCGKVRVTD
jgi:plastocyanin